ncbi:hypothetical protein HDE_09358 [Halotydeus destructor]|nr:hypothetical protein HDE_09358 [Halotydeus destructor]
MVQVRKCRKADIFCGKLHCQLVEDEKFDHSIFHQSFVNEGNNCYVMNSTKLRTGYYQDMVDHMTKCGEGKYCKNQRCVVNDWKALQLNGGANSQVAAPVWPLTVAALVIVLVFCAFAAVVYNYRRSQSRDVEPVSYQNGQ